MELNQEHIRGLIAGFINDKFMLGKGLDGLGDEDSLLEKGIMDSTGVLELVGFIDSSFGISTEDEEIMPENLDTISSITEFISRKKNVPYSCAQR